MLSQGRLISPMKIFGQIVRRAAVVVFGTPIGLGVLLLVHARGYYPEQWVSSVLGNIIGSQGVDWILAGLFGFACLGAWEFFHIGDALRNFGKKKDPEARVIQIIFDENDPRCVVDEPSPYGGIRVRRWHLGVRNASLVKSIDDISVAAQYDRFVECTIKLAHTPYGQRLGRGNPVMLKILTLSPGAEEFVELFGLSPNDTWSDGDIFAQKNRFVIEARGRDTQTVFATLEYDPTSRPIVIRRAS